MRLTILNQFYKPDLSATAHLSTSLAEHRARCGDEVTIVTSRGGYVPQATQEAADTVQENPHVYRIWTPQFGKANLIRRFIDYAVFYLLATWRVVTLPKQDVIISLTTPPFIFVAAYLHKLLHPKTKFVLWSMDCYPEVAERAGVFKEGSFVSRCFRWINKVVYRRMDHLVSLDTAMSDLLEEHYIENNSKTTTHIIPNWEELSLFPRDVVPASWDEGKKYNLQERFTILYLGNAGYGHDFETFLEAAEMLRDEPISFLFVGGGKKWEWLKEQKKSRNLENLILHGYVPKEQTPSVMQTADCALITLTDFAVGLISPSKLHSNLAMELPILYIGPPKSNVEDALQRYGCGASFKHGEAGLFAAYVRKLAHDQELFKRLQKTARKTFEHAYSGTRNHRVFDRLFEGEFKQLAEESIGLSGVWKTEQLRDKRVLMLSENVSLDACGFQRSLQKQVFQKLTATEPAEIFESSADYNTLEELAEIFKDQTPDVLIAWVKKPEATAPRAQSLSSDSLALGSASSSSLEDRNSLEKSEQTADSETDDSAGLQISQEQFYGLTKEHSIGRVVLIHPAGSHPEARDSCLNVTLQPTFGAEISPHNLALIHQLTHALLKAKKTDLAELNLRLDPKTEMLLLAEETAAEELVAIINGYCDSQPLLVGGGWSVSLAECLGILATEIGFQGKISCTFQVEATEKKEKTEKKVSCKGNSNTPIPLDLQDGLRQMIVAVDKNEELFTAEKMTPLLG